MHTVMYNVIYKLNSPKNIIKKIYFANDYLKEYVVCDLTFDFQQGRFAKITFVVRDISQAVKLSIFLFVCILHYFLNKYKIICLEILLGLLEGIILVVQIQKIAFPPVTPPRDLFWGIFAHFCVSLLFLCFSIS